MKIIGISGKAGTGKSTLCDHLIEKMRYAIGPLINRGAFGDCLKEEAAEEFNFPLDLCYSQEGKKQVICHPDLPNGTMSVRRILQYIGEKRRKEDPLYWVKRFDEEVAGFEDSNRVMVVDDVRRPNEAQWVLDKGGVLVRVEPYEGWRPDEGATDVSETGLDGWQEWSLVIRPQFGQLDSAADDVLRFCMKQWK